MSSYWFAYLMKRSRFLCICPIKNEKTYLLALIFIEISPNLEESLLTKFGTWLMLQFLSYKGKKFYRQNDETTYNNPLLSLSIKNLWDLRYLMQIVPSYLVNFKQKFHYCPWKMVLKGLCQSADIIYGITLTHLRTHPREHLQKYKAQRHAVTFKRNLIYRGCRSANSCRSVYSYSSVPQSH